MQIGDIIHRLNSRAVSATNEGNVGLANDLRLAIEALRRLERELQLARSFRSPAPAK